MWSVSSCTVCGVCHHVLCVECVIRYLVWSVLPGTLCGAYQNERRFGDKCLPADVVALLPYLLLPLPVALFMMC